ncbi:MAG TPA: DUF2905 domain-containing protein [Ignavibacteriales bacterium]|nr:DUF2905 domain-containing protein [Ignavibacteriales bacterium]
MSPQFQPLAKIIIFAGIALVIFGLVLLFAGKIPFIGRLPGDIYIQRKNFTFYFPLATSILLSIIISLILYFLRK